ncbi:NAD-dependent protein deacetylase sirtuin-1 [Halocaridina rubra]|uniref:NAD-dependent protein deacetylase sirtuin-1 n=1 Tax=Halocaridina rubra TaxID=373956 RepID=A0AAN8X3I7_HALRR
MKPDIVFFGEGLPDEFHDKMAEDKDECDLLIVIGSSLKVRPVALIPSSVPSHVPQILINREPLRHLTFDVELLGDCDVIINELCQRLGNGWKDLSSKDPMTEIKELPPRPIPSNTLGSGDGEETSSSPVAPLVSPQHAPHPRDESDIEALRACWAPKIRETVASRLPGRNCYQQWPITGLSHSTVLTIIKDKDRILEHVKGSAPMKSTVITKQCSGQHQQYPSEPTVDSRKN